MFAPMPSLSQAKLRLFRALGDKRYRRKHGLFLAEGIKLTAEALASGWPLAAVVHTPGIEPPNRVPEGCTVYEAAPEDFRQISGQQSPEGILVVAKLPEPPAAPPTAGPAFVLWDVRDPGNLGTLLRTADWFGFRGVYLSAGCADPYNPKVVRAAMGAIFRVPVAPWDDFDGLLRAEARRILVADMQGTPLPEAATAGRDLILLGSESHGVPPQFADAPGILPVAIPGGGGAESLNVAIAGGILAYAIAAN
jgi:TrmH family RNA methyltransferase